MNNHQRLHESKRKASMVELLRLAKQALFNFAQRLKTQGWRAGFQWLYGHGLPRLTGIPVLRYCEITPQIYVGPQFRMLGKRKLAALGIQSSISLRSEFDDAAHNLAFQNYCYLPTEDGQAPTLAQLEQGVAFIEHVIHAGGKIYIHCRSGLGRAPTMAAAYFLRHGYTLSEALALIQTKRPFIRITPEQLRQLERFARRTGAPHLTMENAENSI
jgi:protein-tyrosine phosphatase